MKKSAYTVIVFFALSLLCLKGYGASEQSVKVDLPAGEVVKSLKALMAQTELQLFYPSGSLAGVEVKAIRGNYLPSIVLETLLEGTSFVAVQDSATGAFAIIRRKADSGEGNTNENQTNQFSQTNKLTNMNQKTDASNNLMKNFLKGVLGLAVVGSSSAIAQEDIEEVYELTPFEINSSDDRGYIATSTLAGTRTNMNLSDVGSAISVYTEELMEDIGATDNQSLLAYGLGTEVGGARGNFINPSTEGLENDNLVDPQSNNRIRGLTNADTTRNFFKSDIPWDGYNTHRIDVQRGANSVLFGLGSPAGIINNSTRNAGFYDENQIRVTVDKFSSARFTGNFNRVVIEDELAVRVDLLADHQNFRQDPTYENDERIHFAASWQPAALNNAETTTRFSVDYEDGSIRANRPRMVVPIDRVSEFFIPTGENGFLGADYANGGVWGPNSDIMGPGGQTYNPGTAADRDQLQNIPWLSSASNNNSLPIFGFDARNPGVLSVYEDGVNSRGSYLVLNDTESEDFTVVQQNAGYVNPFTETYSRGTNQNVWVAPRLSTVGKRQVADQNGLAFPGFWRDQSFSSTDQFDYMNYLIDGNNKLEQQDFDVLELQFRNTFLNDRLGYQISLFKQDMNFRQDANTGTIYAPNVQVEGNSQDPLSSNPFSPAANANAGRAYIDYELRLTAGSEDIRNREAKQAQVFASLDADDFADPDGLFAYIFGSHNFTGLFKNRELERYRRIFQSIGVDEQTIRWLGGSTPDDPVLNPDYNANNSDPGPGARQTRLANAFGSVQPRIRMYLDTNGPNLTQIQPFVSPIIESGSYSIRGFNANPVSVTPETAADLWISPQGDELTQSENPLNYAGVGNRGTITMVKATDSDEALEYLTTQRFYDYEEVDTKAFVWSGSFLNDALVGMYGWREDEVIQRSLAHNYGSDPAQNDEGRTGGATFDTNSSFVRTTPKEAFESKNWSVKLNASRFFFDITGMEDNLPFDIAFLYNEGEVQNPQPGRRDLLLNDLKPATGSTIDRSVAISTKDGRYSLRVTKYETVQANANAGNTAASDNWRIEQVLSNSVANGVVWVEEGRAAYTDAVMNNFDGVADANEISEARTTYIQNAGFDNVLAWGQNVAQAYRAFENELFTRWPDATSWITRGGPGTNDIGINFPDDTVFIEDNESSGTEFEFTARPTDNWNIAINASKVEVLRSKVFGDEVNELMDFIVENMAGTPGDVPLWGPNGGFGRDRAAPFIGQLITNRALLGTPTGELRKWRYNLITTYNFTEGALQGFGIGGGYRWEDSQSIGFPPIYIDPATGQQLSERASGAALSVDIDSPYRDDSRETFDFWLKYQTKLTDKIDWRIQLNIFNVADDKGTVPLWVNPDGSIGTRGIREGRSWQLSNTFEF